MAHSADALQLPLARKHLHGVRHAQKALEARHLGHGGEASEPVGEARQAHLGEQRVDHRRAREPHCQRPSGGHSLDRRALNVAFLAARFLLPINHLGKRRTETAKMPIEFDLSFTDPETAPFRPRRQKRRVYSLGINPYSPSPKYRPAPYRLETRGVNDEIAGERE